LVATAVAVNPAPASARRENVSVFRPAAPEWVSLPTVTNIVQDR
jgi:hypothetical protein